MPEDLGAPESWEIADLDESMSRLMLSSSRDSKTHELVDVPASASSSVSDSSSSAAVGGDKVHVDLIEQVDQFLREALQNPRERLSSKLFHFVFLFVICFGGTNIFLIDSRFGFYFRLFMGILEDLNCDFWILYPKN